MQIVIGAVWAVEGSLSIFGLWVGKERMLNVPDSDRESALRISPVNLIRLIGSTLFTTPNFIAEESI